MKKIILWLYCFLLSVACFSQNDPTQRIHNNLRAAGGKGLSSRDYTPADSLKLAGIAVSGSSSASGLQGQINTLSTTKLNLSDSSKFVNKLSGYRLISPTEITKLAGLATIATSGAYSDLSGKPTIPTSNTSLANDAGFINATTAKGLFSVTGTGASYNSSTGVFSFTGGGGGSGGVTSVNSQTGAVTLTIPTQASDIGAVSTTTYTTNRAADLLIQKQLASQQIGNVYYANSWTSSTFASDFTQTGSAFSVNSAGKIAVSSTSGLFVNILKLNNLKTNDENVEISILFQLGTVDVNSYGLSIGLRSFNAWSPYNLREYGQTSFSSGQTDLKFWKGEVNPTDQYVTNTNSLSSSTGDLVRLTFSRQGSTFQVRVVNLSTGGSKLLIAQQNMSSTQNFTPMNAAEPAIIAHGNSYTILEVSVKSNSIVQPDIVCLGDSKTGGLVALSDAARYPTLLGNALGKKVAVYAGSADRTVELVQAVDYITKYVHPKYAILNIGRNDLASSVLSATWQTNYASIVSKLKTAGIAVVHLLPIPDAYQGQSSLKSYIQSTYSTDTQIDPSIGWSSASMLGSDNVHPNPTGHAFIATTIQNAYSFP